MNKKFYIFENLHEIAGFAIEKWAGIAEIAIARNGFFTVALSGGKTPVFLYQKLAVKENLPWDKTHIFIVDERFVPFNDEESNYKMINRTLISNVNIPEENVHPIITEENSVSAAAEKYEIELSTFFKVLKGEIPRFDLVLLGVGEDGHTASLFPGTESLKERDHLTVSVIPPDSSKKERITITSPVIQNAENVIFLATGDNKAKVIKEVVEEGCTLPAAIVQPESGNTVFLLDKNAGSFISETREV